MPSSTVRHARAFLDSADPDAVALDLLEKALRATARDRAGRDTLRSLDRWTADQLKLVKVKPAQALTNDDVMDVLAATWLVTQRVPVQSWRRSTAQLHYSIAALLDSLEPDFIPELLKETRRRVADDPDYAAHLMVARREVVRTQRRFARIRRRVVASVAKEPGEDGQLPGVLRAAQGEEEAEVFIAVFVIITVVVVTVWWIAGEDPAKND